MNIINQLKTEKTPQKSIIRCSSLYSLFKMVDCTVYQRRHSDDISYN